MPECFPLRPRTRQRCPLSTFSLLHYKGGSSLYHKIKKEIKDSHIKLLFIYYMIVHLANLMESVGKKTNRINKFNKIAEWKINVNNKLNIYILPLTN